MQRIMQERDYVYPEKRIIILVNDCFWHGHQDCPKEDQPHAVRDKWSRKREQIQRMNRKLWTRLTARGWTVIITWKCELSEKVQRNSGIIRFRDYLIILHKELSRLKLLTIK